LFFKAHFSLGTGQQLFYLAHKGRFGQKGGQWCNSILK